MNNKIKMDEAKKRGFGTQAELSRYRVTLKSALKRNNIRFNRNAETRVLEALVVDRLLAGEDILKRDIIKRTR